MNHITDLQAENTRTAYAIMSGIPAERIVLDAVRLGNKLDDESMLHPECDSVACIAGWMSAHPHFIAQGFQWTGRAVIYKPAGVEILLLFDMCDGLFGSRSIFEQAHCASQPKLEALQRLRLHLYNSGRIDPQRNVELQSLEANYCAR